MTPPSACDVIAIGRTTFDVQRGAELYDDATAVLHRIGIASRAAPAVVTEPGDVGPAIEHLDAGRSPPELLVVVLATFSDTRLISAVLDHWQRELLLWAFPEPRTGGPLRLNSLTGLNLVGYHLGRTTRPFRWIYASPESPGADTIVADALLASPVTPRPLTPPKRSRTLRSGIVGIVGEPPAGFEPCQIDVATRTAIVTDHLPITALFERARSIPEPDLAERIGNLHAELAGCDALDPSPVRGSAQLEAGLRSLAAERRWDGIAVRCWPECFSDFGAACCAPIGALTGTGIAASCEADGLGVLTSLVLQDLAGTPAFVADLVDLDPLTNTGVVWHCGSAPPTLAAPDSPPEAAIHANRHLPLIRQFALAPGPLTLARITQSRRGLRLVIGSGHVLDDARPFAGTCGVVRFGEPVGAVLDTIMREGLEHHYVVVAGDHLDALVRFAADRHLEVVTLGRAPGAPTRPAGRDPKAGGVPELRSVS